MKTKLEKILRIVAAGVFMVALVMNISTTLSDPFSVEIAHAYLTDSNGNPIDSGVTGANGGTDDDGFKVEQKDCTISKSGKGVVKNAINFTMHGKTFTIPVGWDFDANGAWGTTWENAQTLCHTGGTLVSCIELQLTCAQFYASLPN